MPHVLLAAALHAGRGGAGDRRAAAAAQPVPARRGADADLAARGRADRGADARHRRARRDRRHRSVGRRRRAGAGVAGGSAAHGRGAVVLRGAAGGRRRRAARDPVDAEPPSRPQRHRSAALGAGVAAPRPGGRGGAGAGGHRRDLRRDAGGPARGAGAGADVRRARWRSPTRSPTPSRPASPTRRWCPRSRARRAQCYLRAAELDPARADVVAIGRARLELAVLRPDSALDAHRSRAADGRRRRRASS